MKTCNQCQEAKPLDAFAKHTIAPQGRRPVCKSCTNQYERRKYRQTLEMIRALKSVPCMDCSQRYPPCVMDFDHVRGEKKFNMAKAGNRFSRELILEEAAKCDIVCANCHRIRTAARKREADTCR